MPGDSLPYRLQAVIPADCAGLRLDQVLPRLFADYSRARLQAWIKSGRVSLAGKTPEAKARVWGGEEVILDVIQEPSMDAPKPQPIVLDIEYEDSAIVVIHKPAGLVVHPGNGNPDGTVLNALLNHDPLLANLPRAGLVHRLDKDTSGLMVVARTDQSLTHLVRQMQARTVSRVYSALAVGRTPAQGRIERAIGRHPTQRVKMAVSSRGRPAVTHFETLRQGAHWSLLRCRLETGRTHQIRVHMAELGHPLIGDMTYGSRSREGLLPEVARRFGRQALHAIQLELTHPVTARRMAWQRREPEDFEQLLHILERNEAAR